MALTRSSSLVWQIGQPLEHLYGTKLPSGREVMQNLIYHHNTKKLTIRVAANKVYNELLPFWEKARIPTRAKNLVISQIDKLYQQRRGLQKHKTRNDDIDLRKQAQYSAKLDSLFDIARADAEKIITIDEDREFLRRQREDRGGSLGTMDGTLAQRERRSTKRKADRQHQHQQRTVPAAAAGSATVELASSTSSESDGVTPVDTPASTPEKRQKPKLSASVAAALDRTNTSVRKATMLVASVQNVAGSSSANISRSSLHRHRLRRRKELATAIHVSYKTSKSVVHWDGKLLPDCAGPASSTALVERLAVLLTSTANGVTKLLGVPQLDVGTGAAAASAVMDNLVHWDAVSDVVGLCFDTTAVNTGQHTGACVTLERKLDRNLLWLACRHHMLEVLLSDVFGVCLAVSTGPEILIFKHFRTIWPQLVKDVPVTSQPLILVSEDTVQFIRQQLAEHHIREDYLELLQLAGRCVGINIEAALRRPGAMHRARWMAKAIYCLKMLLLYNGNEQTLKLTGRQLRGLQRFGRFVCLVYLEAWYTCRSAADAPFNDIKLQMQIRDYDDTELVRVGLKMLKRHSWYVSPEMATAVLFSDKVDDAMKSQLVSTMTNERGPHLVTSLPQTVADLQISTSFFATAQLDSSFLTQPVNQWTDNDAYTTALNFVTNLACVNDCAERGIALIQQFNASTTDEEQRQYLLQVVDQHRKKFVDPTVEELGRL